MNMTDDYGSKITIGDYVMISEMVHKIELSKINGKNKVCFRPITDGTHLVEYHYLTCKQVEELGCYKLINPDHIINAS